MILKIFDSFFNKLPTICKKDRVVIYMAEQCKNGSYAIMGVNILIGKTYLHLSFVIVIFFVLQLNAIFLLSKVKE